MKRRPHDLYHPQITPQKIPPLPATEDRPLWSVMVPALADRSFLAATLKSVLADESATHIEVIDSGDDDEARRIVDEVGKGRVAVHKAPGLSPQQAWNLCLQRSRGRWVHVLHDDDIVYPGFYRLMRDAFEKHPQIAAAFCRVQFLDEQGKKLDLQALELHDSGVFEKLSTRLAHGNAVSFPSMVVKRDAYEALGGFDPKLDITADWEMWMRLACRYPVYYDTRPLAGYRRRAKAKDTSPLVRSAGDIRELHGTINAFAHYLPPGPVSAALLHHSREHIATIAVRSARQLSARGDLFAAMNQLREAFACAPTPKVMREIEIGGTVRHFDTFLQQLNEHAQHHRVALLPPPATLQPLRDGRLLVARQWLDFGHDEVDDLLVADLGNATATLMGSAVRDESPDAAEQALIDQLRTDLADTASPSYSQRLMAALVMARPWEWPAVEFANLTGPVLGTYLRDATQLPSALASPAKLDAYADYLTDLLGRVRRFVQSAADAQTRHDVATLVANTLNLLTLRSTGRDLADVLRDRASIVEHAMAGIGVKGGHAFPAARPSGTRARVAIITNALGTGRETFEALPVFQLDRTRLHVTAYATAAGEASVERLVREKVDRFVVLSGDVASQVRGIRHENYDAILIAADITVSANPAAVLAGARLARRQLATASYGLRPGLIPSIDEVWSDTCFLIPPNIGAATIWPAREQLGLRPEPIVFVSAANALRITPAVRAMWASILRDMPGSRLVLLPYSPQWGVGEYAGVPFVRAMNAALAAEKVDTNRMIVVNPLPQRQDVLAVLKLGDVYLDSYPEGGGLSIYDALEAGLPVVSMKRSDGLPGLYEQVGGPVADSESAYHELALRYANSPEERDKLREKVQQATITTPRFLDVAAFGKKLTDALT